MIGVVGVEQHFRRHDGRQEARPVLDIRLGARETEVGQDRVHVAVSGHVHGSVTAGQFHLR